MKIRIKGNSIRYRLTQTEIDNFGKSGLLEEKTEFPNGASFFYSLQKKEGISKMEASFSEDTICVFVPVKLSEEWITTDVVGFNSKMDIDEEKELFLLIEKDLVCIEDTIEDQSDNYPNPNKAC